MIRVGPDKSTDNCKEEGFTQHVVDDGPSSGKQIPQYPHHAILSIVFF